VLAYPFLALGKLENPQKILALIWLLEVLNRCFYRYFTFLQGVDIYSSPICSYYFKSPAEVHKPADKAQIRVNKAPLFFDEIHGLGVV
jgi:hypothetical protein